MSKYSDQSQIATILNNDLMALAKDVGSGNYDSYTILYSNLLAKIKSDLLFDRSRLHVNLSANQTITDVTDTKIEFDNIEFDLDSAWSNINYEWTCPRNGKYLLICHLKPHDNVGVNHIMIYKNATEFIISQQNERNFPFIVRLLTLSINDKIQIWFKHDSGSSQDVLSEESTYLQIIDERPLSL